MRYSVIRESDHLAHAQHAGYYSPNNGSGNDYKRDRYLFQGVFRVENHGDAEIDLINSRDNTQARTKVPGRIIESGKTAIVNYLVRKSNSRASIDAGQAKLAADAIERYVQQHFNTELHHSDDDDVIETDDYLEHHGVKGMKWGVINEDEKKGGRKSAEQSSSNSTSSSRNSSGGHSYYSPNTGNSSQYNLDVKKNVNPGRNSSGSSKETVWDLSQKPICNSTGIEMPVQNGTTRQGVIFNISGQALKRVLDGGGDVAALARQSVMNRLKEFQDNGIDIYLTEKQIDMIVWRLVYAAQNNWKKQYYNVQHALFTEVHDMDDYLEHAQRGFYLGFDKNASVEYTFYYMSDTADANRGVVVELAPKNRIDAITVNTSNHMSVSISPFDFERARNIQAMKNIFLSAFNTRKRERGLPNIFVTDSEASKIAAKLWIVKTDTMGLNLKEKPNRTRESKSVAGQHIGYYSPNLRHSYTVIPAGEELQHHGILGQKWGVRRFQNADGSLTDKGRLHYGVKMAKAYRKGDLDTYNKVRSNIRTGEDDDLLEFAAQRLVAKRSVKNINGYAIPENSLVPINKKTLQKELDSIEYESKLPERDYGKDAEEQKNFLLKNPDRANNSTYLYADYHDTLCMASRNKPRTTKEQYVKNGYMDNEERETFDVVEKNIKGLSDSEKARVLRQVSGDFDGGVRDSGSLLVYDNKAGKIIAYPYFDDREERESFLEKSYNDDNIWCYLWGEEYPS